MKNVAIDLQPCCGKRSGVGNVAYELARRLHSSEEIQFHGNIFNFIGRNDNSSVLNEIDYPSKECKFIPYGVYRRIWDFIPLKYNTIFGHADLSVFFNFVMPKTLDGKSLVYIHDFTYIRYPETMLKKNYTFISESTAYSISHADRLLVNSEFTKCELIELFDVNPDYVDVIYPSLSMNDISIDCSGSIRTKYTKKESEIELQKLFKRLGIPNDSPYLLFVSTIEPRKNIIRLLEAFDSLKREKQLPHVLVLAGGKGWNNEEIYSVAERLFSKSDIFFTGFISNDEKNALYYGADAFVFPSIYEGFGIPPLEAMSLGCPVVVSKAGALPEVCGDAAVYVNPEDSDSIAEGIYRALFDQTLRSEITRRGFIQVSKFSWDKSALKLYNIIRKEVVV